MGGETFRGRVSSQEELLNRRRLLSWVSEKKKKGESNTQQRKG